MKFVQSRVYHLLKFSICYWKESGFDFSMYLYVPQIDPVTEAIRYDRGDHNHVFIRATKSFRQRNHPDLDLMHLMLPSLIQPAA